MYKHSVGVMSECVGS